ncbi:hypothetical protein [Chitinivorax sp. B]|uniref:hypothetical protein n=1 Tax=Chitinivorax sp. B TaxID=2502235 RepID=UPI0010F46DF4|nr:hypothetical protein [Chitinivorax sp. B]
MKTLLLAVLLLPTTLRAEETTPETIVASRWQALSKEPGRRPDIKEGHPNLNTLPTKEFIRALDRVTESGFYECEVSRDLQVFDRFATVYSVVESRTEKLSTKSDFTGVNSIQLYKSDKGWQVISLYYHIGPNGLSVPLNGSEAGKCIM